MNDVRRATRQRLLDEGRNRIVLEGLRGVGSIAELCRCTDIASSLPADAYYPPTLLDDVRRSIIAGKLCATTGPDDVIAELDLELAVYASIT
ncbi:MAG: hypothetical protein O9972_30110 [Burkholderiales bacterium]|nr:hypothetical protein [Burkholderiales bacterium]